MDIFVGNDEILRKDGSRSNTLHTEDTRVLPYIDNHMNDVI